MDTQQMRSPARGGAGLLGFHWGEPGDGEGTHHCRTHTTECRPRWVNFSSQVNKVRVTSWRLGKL
jgi:hypothetical protein